MVAARGPEDRDSSTGRDDVGPCFADSSAPSRESHPLGPRENQPVDGDIQATHWQGILAPRIVTPLLVGKMLVPALQIPVHPPGSQHEPRGLPDDIQATHWQGIGGSESSCGPEDRDSATGRDEVGPCFADSSPPSRESRSNGLQVTHHLGRTDNKVPQLV